MNARRLFVGIVSWLFLLGCGKGFSTSEASSEKNQNPDPPIGCSFNNTPVASGASVQGYPSATVPFGQTCQAVNVSCLNGALTPPNAFATCAVGQPAMCSFNNQNIPSGGTVQGYLMSMVPFGQTCQAQTITCNNGTLNPPNYVPNCTVAPGAACAFNGQSIPSGGGVTAYQSASVPFGQTCAQQTRACTNGNLSGTYTFAACTVDAPPGGIDTSIVPPDRTTKWNPGILSDEQLNLPLGADGLPTRTTICATLNPGQDIQAAINACPEGQVVKLNPGTFTVANTILVNRGVVLRGSGSDGAPSGTTIVKSNGGSVVAIGPDRDQTCYGGTGIDLVQDGAKESLTINLGASGINTAQAARNFTPGDLALVDLVDDSTIKQGDCSFYKRVSGRSVSQRVEIKAVDRATGTLTLGSPLHWPFKSSATYKAQITRVTNKTTKWAGLEAFKIQGGRNSSYNGAMAGGIDISNAAYCWVKDIQSGGTIGGAHIFMTGTYRCVVRDSYLHHSADYNYSADCYGIVLRCGSAENLIENNIVRFMNKPIQLNTTGGGNVIAYNYADNAWSDQDGGWQETPIDCHCAFPHMDLIEGNWAPKMAAPNTHGNAGYLTFFRNYSSSQFAAPAVWGKTAVQSGQVGAIQLDGGTIGMNVVGNVLGSNTNGTALKSQAYESSSSNTPSVFLLGQGGSGANDPAFTTLFRNGNFDYFNNKTFWLNNMTKPLPASFYRTSKPAWWPAGSAWPWVGPDLNPMVGTLPAKARSDSKYNPPVP